MPPVACIYIMSEVKTLSLSTVDCRVNDWEVESLVHKAARSMRLIPEVCHYRSILGDWTSLGNPCLGGSEMEIAQTFGAQSTFVLPAPGRPGRFIFMADQWNPEDLSSSR